MASQADLTMTPPGERTASGLLRVLGTAFGLALAVGGMIGGGILRAPGVIFGQVPSLTLVAGLLVLCALHTLLSANIWAEVSTSVPLSGGTVVVVRRAFGDTPALVSGWTDILCRVAFCGKFEHRGG